MAITYIPNNTNYDTFAQAMTTLAGLNSKALDRELAQQQWLAELGRQTENDQMFQDATGYSLRQANPFRVEAQGLRQNMGPRPDAGKSAQDIAEEARAQVSNDAFERLQRMRGNTGKVWQPAQGGQPGQMVDAYTTEAGLSPQAAGQLERLENMANQQAIANQQQTMTQYAAPQMQAAAQQNAARSQYDQRAALLDSMSQEYLPAGYTDKQAMLERYAAILGPDHPTVQRIRDFAEHSADTTYRRNLTPLMMRTEAKKGRGGEGGGEYYNVNYLGNNYVMQSAGPPSTENIVKFLKAQHGISNPNPAYVFGQQRAGRGARVGDVSQQEKIDDLLAQRFGGQEYTAAQIETVKRGLPPGWDVSRERLANGKYRIAIVRGGEGSETRSWGAAIRDSIPGGAGANRGGSSGL